MADTTTAQPSSQPGLLARMIGVLTSPRETFAAVVARPRWLGVMVITILVAAACQYLILSSPDMQEAMIAQATRNPNISDAQVAATEQFIPRLPAIFAGAVLFLGPLVSVIVSGILLMIFSTLMGGAATFKQVYAVVAHAGVVSMLSGLLSAGLITIGAPPTGPNPPGANLGIFVPMLDETSFVDAVSQRDRSRSGLVDRDAVDWSRGSLQTPHRRDRVHAVLFVRVVRACHRIRPVGFLRSFDVLEKGFHHRWDRAGPGRRGRRPTCTSAVTPGLSVTAEGVRARDLEAIVSASGKIQPKRQVNVSANTMGRVTRLAVEEGQRVKAGQFLLEIDPRSLDGTAAARRSQRGRRAVVAAAGAHRRCEPGARDAGAGAAEPEAAAGPLEGRTDDARGARAGAERRRRCARPSCKAREQEIQTREQQIKQEQAGLATTRYNLSQVIISSPMDGIVTRRNIEEGENVVVGTMNNAGTVLLTIADMSVHRGGSRGRRDRHPDRHARPGGQGHDRRGPRPDVQGTRDRDRQQPDSDDDRRRASGQRQATNFKVVITLDEEVPDVRPGFTCTAEITTATRKNVVCRADPGADRARDAVRRQGRAGPRAAAAAERRRSARASSRPAPRLDRAAARPHAQGNRRRVRRSATGAPSSRRSRSASPASGTSRCSTG